MEAGGLLPRPNQQGPPITIAGISQVGHLQQPTAVNRTAAVNLTGLGITPNSNNRNQTQTQVHDLIIQQQNLQSQNPQHSQNFHQQICIDLNEEFPGF